MYVWENDRLLLIERRKGTLGFAPPAGHVDGDPTFETAASRELYEEVGLTVISLECIGEGRKNNPCRRIDGTWHYWKMYTVAANGKLKRSEDETKQAGYYSRAQVAALAMRTEQYLRGEIPEASWEALPGLEPVAYEWLQDLELLKA